MISITDGVVIDRPDLAPAVLTPSRTISGTEFIALWTPAEVAAGIAADPRLLVGAFKALSQNSVNLDSPETAQLLALAVSKGALTQDRADKIKARQVP